MIVLDSSAWIEGWKDAGAVDRIDEVIVAHGGDPDRVIIPAPVVFETTLWLIRNLDSEAEVAEHAASLEQHEFLSIDAGLARRAALTAATTGLAHADATILAAARARHARLLTYDSDFAGIPDVVILDR